MLTIALPSDRDEHTLRSHTVAEGAVYHLRFGGCGWAVVVVSDMTGMLAITSDWGNWSHRWNPEHLGAPSLTAFLARGSYDYLANKLIPGGETRVLDYDATRDEWKREILRRRRSGSLDRFRARELWDDVCAFDWPTLGQAYPSWDLVDDPWDMNQNRPAPEYLALTQVVLPAFVGVLRERAEAAA